MIRRIQFWIHPNHIYINTRVLGMFKDALDRIREQNPNVKIHVLLETKDRYKALRSKLAKRTAEKHSAVKGPDKKKRKSRKKKTPTYPYTPDHLREPTPAFTRYYDPDPVLLVATDAKDSRKP